MTIYAPLLDSTADARLRPWLARLPPLLAQAFDPSTHGDLPRWQAAINSLPDLAPPRPNLDADAPTFGTTADCPPETQLTIENALRQLHPWRKGPFSVYGVFIDSEWRSDLKWRRLSGHIEPLQGKLVLDVGCGNGYHAWRMAGAGARLAIGIDPTLLSVMQYQAIQHFAGPCPVYVLPLGIEDLPPQLAAFDTVFSMGVLYHRRSPLDHLLELRGLLRNGGELVLETLVIEGGGGQTLVPPDRYARMRNVWFIPSCETLASWLKRCGFRDIRLLDVSPTTPAEQRGTSWMRFQSLADCLDSKEPSRTLEGHPAPIRAIFLAKN